MMPIHFCWSRRVLDESSGLTLVGLVCDRGLFEVVEFSARGSAIYGVEEV